MDLTPSTFEAVPIFPLPEVVLFPGQALPLHIFEPRYRAMTADVLSGDGLMAVALLKPDYESRYFTPYAPMHDVVGVGRVAAAHKRDDGRYDILLNGFARAQVLREYEPTVYRRGDLRVLRPHPLDDEAAGRARNEVLGAIRDGLCCDAGLRENLLAAAGSCGPLSEMLDRLAAALPAPGEVRQSFLSQCCQAMRAKAVADHIRTLGRIAANRRRCGDAGSHLN